MRARSHTGGYIRCSNAHPRTHTDTPTFVHSGRLRAGALVCMQPRAGGKGYMRDRHEAEETLVGVNGHGCEWRVLTGFQLFMDELFRPVLGQLRLITVQEREAKRVLSFQQANGKPELKQWTQLECVWRGLVAEGPAGHLSIWSPSRLPKGYVSFGHYAHTSHEQPAEGAFLTVAKDHSGFARPRSFRLTWETWGTEDVGGGKKLFVWQPVPAADTHVALGCVATTISSPPPLDSVRCVHRRLLVTSEHDLCPFFMINPPNDEREGRSESARVRTQLRSNGQEDPARPPPVWNSNHGGWLVRDGAVDAVVQAGSGTVEFGVIHVVVRYLHASQALVVRVREARGLPVVGKEGIINCYVKAKVLPTAFGIKVCFDCSLSLLWLSFCIYFLS